MRDQSDGEKQRPNNHEPGNDSDTDGTQRRRADQSGATELIDNFLSGEEDDKERSESDPESVEQSKANTNTHQNIWIIFGNGKRDQQHEQGAHKAENCEHTAKGDDGIARPA